jgi:anti-sigma B factor antagonist
VEPDDRVPQAALEVVTDNSRVPPRLQLYGELDINSADGAVAAVGDFSHDGVNRLDVDLAGLRFCDVRGLHALVAAKQDAAARGLQVTYVGESAFLRRVARITGCDRELWP